jgi:hypothetical protein
VAGDGIPAIDLLVVAAVVAANDTPASPNTDKVFPDKVFLDRALLEVYFACDMGCSSNLLCDSPGA